ncbi:MAG TPA: c-type cytochrome [Chitinophagaceae bacterium]
MKTIIFLFFAVCVISCGGNSGNDTTNTSSAKPEVKDPEAVKGLELITKSDCFACHKLTEKNIGPSYASVAQKYKILNDATMDSIVTQINKGGKGKWGTIPMMPHPAISKEDAQSMAHYIMSIKP